MTPAAIALSTFAVPAATSGPEIVSPSAVVSRMKLPVDSDASTLCWKSYDLSFSITSIMRTQVLRDTGSASSALTSASVGPGPSPLFGLQAFGTTAPTSVA